MSTFMRSKTPSVSESEENVVRVPSYQRGTAASTGKRRTKVVPTSKPEPKLSSGGGRRKRRLEVTGQLKGYQQLTKAAKAKVSPRSYVLQGVRVEVPQIAIVEFDDCEEDKTYFAGSLDALAARVNPTLESVESLFVGRHTYCDDEGETLEEEDPWKEVLLKKYRVDYDLYRLALREDTPYYGEEDEE